jgi:hypothetical protein
MNGWKLIGSALLIACLLLIFADSGEAAWKRYKQIYRSDAAAWKAEAYPMGAPLFEYGKDPHFVPNQHPWNCPAMFSGFRHYHMPPPPPPELFVPLVPPPAKIEEAPAPRKKL